MASASESGGSQQPPGKSSGQKSETIEEMVGRLKLTAAESRKIVIDDREESKAPSWALAGRILVPPPKVYHINTICAALRPAWGNPKGLIFIDGGPNMFVAELASERDKDRIWERSPWTVNKHAVVLEDYQSCRRPSELKFDRLLIWVRILDLPRNMINTNWGMKIAADVGNEVVKVDTSNKYSGQYLRARVFIDVNEPLRRWVAIDSTLREACDWYELQYEDLPYFCFSCGLLGHSATLCLNPAERDENDEWPYGSRLRAADDIKFKAPPMAGGSSFTGYQHRGGMANAQTGNRGSMRLVVRRIHRQPVAVGVDARLVREADILIRCTVS
ncbi:hypothetical protein QYE76_004681 [Lolium multiflorum]|uniref:CCHC-type domain-containing protein n=1 Tax=Lolium multiflorum TaxID=4521 RepID=A0AAD8RR72_LOLMU|nr:hypothetical protein QYE76_004681 [Lolium multiflorum]